MIVLSEESAFEEVLPFLDDTMGSLSRQEEEALILRFYQDLNYRQIGDRLGLGLGLGEDGVRKRVQQALQKLHRRLQQPGGRSLPRAFSPQGSRSISQKRLLNHVPLPVRKWRLQGPLIK